LAINAVRANTPRAPPTITTSQIAQLLPCWTTSKVTSGSSASPWDLVTADLSSDSERLRCLARGAADWRSASHTCKTKSQIRAQTTDSTICSSLAHVREINLIAQNPYRIALRRL